MSISVIIVVAMLGQLRLSGDPQPGLLRSLPPNQREAARKIIDLGGLVTFKEIPEGYGVEVIGFGENFTDAEIPLLWPFRGTTVFEIGFGNAKVSETSITRVLHEFPKLRGFSITHAALGDSALIGLANFRELESIVLQGPKFTSASLPLIGQQRALRHLSLGETAVEDIPMAHLEGLSKLEWLGLSNTNITSTALASVGKLTNLEIMTLRGTQIDDEGLKHLAGLKRLRQLDLSGTKITNAGMVHIAQLIGLDKLTVINTKVDAAGVALLQKMPKLKEVDWIDDEEKATPEQKRFSARFHLYLPANANRWKDLREQFERGELKIE